MGFSVLKMGVWGTRGVQSRDRTDGAIVLYIMIIITAHHIWKNVSFILKYTYMSVGVKLNDFGAGFGSQNEPQVSISVRFCLVYT